MKNALTIAGSDTCGGAGIQADIKTMTVHKVYAQSVVTALTAQNTTGVKEIFEVTEAFLAAQLDSVFEDIFPDAVKCGMIPNSGLISVVAKKLRQYEAKNIVVDPVMVSTSGHALMVDSALTTLIEELLPLAIIVTPNIPEAQVLSEMSISSKAEMQKAAEIIYKKTHSAVLIKGGHGILDASDYLFTGDDSIWLYERRIDNPNTHGTGCTLSSAIASNLALGYDLITAVERAKKYLTGAIADGLDLGKGAGPMNHMYAL